MSGRGEARLTRAGQEQRRDQIAKAGICPIRSVGDDIHPCDQARCAWFHEESSHCAVHWIAQVIGHHGEHLREGLDSIAQVVAPT